MTVSLLIITCVLLLVTVLFFKKGSDSNSGLEGFNAIAVGGFSFLVLLCCFIAFVLTSPL